MSPNLLTSLLVARLKKNHWMIIQKDQEDVQLPPPQVILGELTKLDIGLFSEIVRVNVDFAKKESCAHLA